MSSCSKEDSNTIFNREIEQIEKYIKDNNLVAEKTVHGVYYVIESPGSADRPTISNTVIMNYRGYFLDQKEFDKGDKVEFPLFQLIEGWQIGIPKFGKGGKGKLLVPSRLGYGSGGRGSIPPNAILIFDIELLDWK
jgi:FKBP-type peptidyl-prolyl cis-trans isomerase